MNQLNRKAIEILTADNYRFNIDMIDPLENGLADALEADSDGVLIDAGGCKMWTASNETRARELTDIVASCYEGDSVCVHTKFGLEYAAEKLKVTWRQIPCFVAAFFEKTKFDIKTDLTFKKLDHSYDELVWKTYNFFRGEPEAFPDAVKSIERGIIGGFLGDECVGYIGTHSEGTMGMLEVFPEFRRRGYGRALEEKLMNDFIENKRIPFCHILEDNNASLELQSSMGMWLSGADKVYWMGR